MTFEYSFKLVPTLALKRLCNCLRLIQAVSATSPIRTCPCDWRIKSVTEVINSSSVILECASSEWNVFSIREIRPATFLMLCSFSSKELFNSGIISLAGTLVFLNSLREVRVNRLKPPVLNRTPSKFAPECAETSRKVVIIPMAAMLSFATEI